MIHILIPTTPERRHRIAECSEHIRTNAGLPHIISTYENVGEGYIAAIHKMLERLKDDTMVLCFADDLKMSEPDTLKRMQERFDEAFPDRDGVLNADDGFQHGRIITQPFCTAYTMRKYTFKGYTHNCADREFTIVMKEKGKYLYAPEIKIEHMHWRAGKSTHDETYKLMDAKYQSDLAVFAEREKNNFEPKNDV